MTPRNRLKNGVGLVLLPFVSLMLLRWFEHRQVYHPTGRWEAEARQLGRAWELAEFTAGDGPKLQGWFFPVRSEAPQSGWVVLHCHGNAGNISHRIEIAKVLLDSGVSVLLFDYRGYGRSEGRPSEEGTYRDAQAAYEWLRKRGFAAGQILAFGESLGGGVATELVLREATGGLVLQSTFTSIPDLGAELFPWLPVRWLASIRYDNRSKLPRVTVPVLLLHSREDTLISFDHAERNSKQLRGGGWLRELIGDHNDFPAVGREAFLADFAEWLRHLDGAAEASKTTAP